jgi:transglutaminase-like putative cysteine protease
LFLGADADRPVERRVGSRLVFEATGPFEAILQIAVSGTRPATVDERLTVTRDGTAIAVQEVGMPHFGRAHVLKGQPGLYIVDYAATVVGRARPHPVEESDRIAYLRPSRYSESDRLASVARSEFHSLTDPADVLAAVSSWVGSRLRYVPGSSGPTSGAVDTLLQGEGVCRDYAHLVAALLRAKDIPARFAAVYAPGLNPMDFHAVVEALVGDAWRVVDATILAPRSSLVRIATGRDAADTAFFSTYGGAVNLIRSEVTAIVEGLLPGDDIAELASLR